MFLVSVSIVSIDLMNEFFKPIFVNTLYIYQPFGTMVRVFANGPGDQGSIPGQVIPKTQKMVLDPSLLNIRHYKVWIKGK